MKQINKRNLLSPHWSDPAIAVTLEIYCPRPSARVPKPSNPSCSASSSPRQADLQLVEDVQCIDDTDGSLDNATVDNFPPAAQPGTSTAKYDHKLPDLNDYMFTSPSSTLKGFP